jgi:hypothetical protein
MARPDIKTIATGKEFKRWYWLKSELVTYCKAAGISYAGGKFEVTDRIAALLDNSIVSESKTVKTKSIAAFNRAKEKLTLNTIITASYTNGPNSRIFFKEYCGDRFRFTIPFMEWMKENINKTLKDAVAEWKRQDELSRQKGFTSVIPKHNQYNQYIRDFFAANPEKSLQDARRCWKLKKLLPSGRHFYEPADLNLKISE